MLRERTVRPTEKEALPGRMADDVVRRRSQHFHDAGQLLDLVLARENWVARVQFRQDAACKYGKVDDDVQNEDKCRLFHSNSWIIDSSI